MSGADSQVAHHEDFLTPPPLGPELVNGKWRVRVIDHDENITEEVMSGKQLWSSSNRRVILDFNKKGQPIKDSGGLFGSWLGSLSTDLHLLPINYTDWRKVPKFRKDMAWRVIQKKFYFDDPIKRKKYVLSTLGCRCRELKQRLWDVYRRNTLEESVAARPGLVPLDQWEEFVEMQFTDKAKKMRERNLNNSKKKIPHALGKKSIARKADEMEDETGIEPNRTEIFIASRTRADGSFVCDEARISVDKLKQVMTENRSEPPSEKDAFEKVFGPEHSGRVRCVGRGPTPSKYFSNLECSSSNDITALQSRMNGFEEKLSVITDLQSCINGFGQKLEIVTDALFALVKQVNVKAENTKPNTSVNSDQESYISKT